MKDVDFATPDDVEQFSKALKQRADIQFDDSTIVCTYDRSQLDTMTQADIVAMLESDEHALDCICKETCLPNCISCHLLGEYACTTPRTIVVTY